MIVVGVLALALLRRWHGEERYPANDKALPDGEKGELVLTSLTKEALPGTAHSMRRMEELTGRSDDMLIIRGVNVPPSQIEELILRQPEFSAQSTCSG